MNEALREALKVRSAHPVSGGCIHRCFRVQISSEIAFLKVNSESYADAFAAEADGLAALKRAGAAAPAPLACGVAGGEAYLLLEYLELGAPPDFAALGRMLARVHRATLPRYGWSRDNYLGATIQRNAWSGNWRTFWLEQRLRPQLELARRRGFDLPLPSLTLLDDHHPQASLLHGDLWSGNAGFTPRGPVVFDPAVYCGDREADLAMTELFGGYPREFYEAYGALYPLEPGYERRKPLYNLYHLLNHLNLFGAGYLRQVRETLRLLGGA